MNPAEIPCLGLWGNNGGWSVETQRWSLDVTQNP